MDYEEALATIKAYIGGHAGWNMLREYMRYRESLIAEYGEWSNEVDKHERHVVSVAWQWINSDARPMEAL